MENQAKYALITGASKGIGKAISRELAERKINLILVARNDQQLKELSQELNQQFGISALVYVADLSRPSTPQEIFDWCTRENYAISILVNNAGYGLSGPFNSYPLQEHLDNMQVNMNAVVQMTYLFLPQLKKNTSAYILNISSSAAFQAVPFLSLYAASKSFVLQFSRGLQIELMNTPVSVTTVCPGATDTDFANRAKVGEKGLKLAAKFNMTPEVVAKMAVKGMFLKRTEIITGTVNKLGAFMAWLLPKKTVEKASAKIYQ